MGQIKNGQSRETGNIEEKQNKTTTQYVLDASGDNSQCLS
jgi:hypothetical protein